MASFNIFMRVGVCVCGYGHSLTSCYILKHWSAQRNRKRNPLIEQEQGGNLSDKSCESTCGHFLHVIYSWIVKWTWRKHTEKRAREGSLQLSRVDHQSNVRTFSISPMVMWLCLRVGKDYNDYKCTGRSLEPLCNAFLLVSFKPSNYK